MLTAYPQSLDTAWDCCLCPVSQTLPGLLRVYAKSIPKADIRASLTLFDTVPQHNGLSSSAAAARVDIEIPADGWKDNDGMDSSSALYVDIPNIAADSDLIPIVTIIPEYLEAAGDCGISPYARTIPGALRVYADRAPESPIKASLALLGVTQSITGSIIPGDDTAGEGGAYVLPAATATRLGGVRIVKGSGLTVDANGNLGLEKATGEQVVNIFKDSKG